ncbi:unnamed protein product [Anisakis simplex]|uniref:AMMECR1 domain-containing protein n=1 Tax=Anisakis simplex TaxID=6269 RepID=A0A0M3J095_ANISI|nr:unnamed protein product [Anisakis simplex]
MSLSSGNSSTSSMSSTASNSSDSYGLSLVCPNVLVTERSNRKRTHSVSRLTLQSGQVASMHMTAYCFDVIYAALRNLQAPKVPQCIPNDKYPLFVTWKKGYERRLRGCIGTFSNLVLHKGLHEYAIISTNFGVSLRLVRKNKLQHAVCEKLVKLMSEEMDCFASLLLPRSVNCVS